MEHKTIANPDGEIIAATADVLKECGYETKIYNIKRSKDLFWEAAIQADNDQLNLLPPKTREAVKLMKTMYKA